MFAKPIDSGFYVSIAAELQIPDPEKTKAEEVLNGDTGRTCDDRENSGQTKP